MFLEHEGTGEKVSSNLYFYHLSLLRVQCQLPRLSYSVSIVPWAKNDFRHEESKRSIPPGHGASPTRRNLSCFVLLTLDYSANQRA